MNFNLQETNGEGSELGPVKKDRAHSFGRVTQQQQPPIKQDWMINELRKLLGDPTRTLCDTTEGAGRYTW